MKTKIKVWASSIVLMGLILIVTSSCNKSDQAKLPDVFTRGIRMVTPSSATLDGEITTNGGSRLSGQGFCWSTLHNPDITDSIIMMGFQDVCRYSTRISGLSQHTGYYVRAYATNGIGTAYGEELTFTTESDYPPGESGTVADVEGNVYQTIRIGTQFWMAENLKTSRYNNGDIIGTTSQPLLAIREEDSAKYQWAYNGDEINVATYGRLYTWYAAADARNVCPIGWHLSTELEWGILIAYLSGVNDAGGKLKETGTAHWQSPNYGATNSFGFTALPGGSRDVWEEFANIGTVGVWWLGTASSLWFSATAYYIYASGNYISGTWDNKWQGHSVRCVKDN